MENPNVSNLLLPSVPECNNMTLEGVAELYDHMRKETILKQFCDLQKIKYRESINQFYIVIDRKQYTAKTRRELIDKLFEKYCGDAVTTLEQAYLEWMHWRASINTSSKTLKENKNEWKHYIQDSQLAKMQVAKIEIVDFEAFLYDVTMDFAIIVLDLAFGKARTKFINNENKHYMRGVRSNPILGDVKLSDLNTRMMEKYYQNLLKVKSRVVNNRKPNTEYLSCHTVREVHKLLRRGAVYTGVQTYQFELRISRIYWRGKVGNHKRFNRRR